MYWILIIGLMIISWAASSNVKRKFKKYTQVGLQMGLSGKEVAELMLRDNGLHDVQVISVPGQLTDHYNPANKTVNLSPEIYQGRSVMATAVAAHECGHAVQHAKAYKPLEMRSALVPIQNASGRIINIIFIGMLIGSFALGMFAFEAALPIIIGCYAVFTAFAFITLPVEYDATKRALAWIDERNIVTGQEHEMATDALNAASKTYLVAALGSLAMLLYYVMLFLGND